MSQLGGTASPGSSHRVLTPKGTLVLSSGDSPGRVIGPVGRIIRALMLSLFVSQRMPALVAKASSTDPETLKEMIEAGSVTPVVDRTYSLSDAAQPDADGKRCSAFTADEVLNRARFSICHKGLGHIWCDFESHSLRVSSSSFRDVCVGV